ncbi:hypothetical protein ACTZWW_04125 [Salinarimonas sp. NSM]|uniref:hypothetical protein n=1 Tax=Salinarimonas sp. NSM TaxID=3458003 RepID=UPI004035B10C
MTPDIRELIDLMHEQEKDLVVLKMQVARLEAHGKATMQVFTVIAQLLAIKGTVSREEMGAALDEALVGMRTVGAPDEAIALLRSLRTTMTRPIPSAPSVKH